VWEETRNAPKPRKERKGVLRKRVGRKKTLLPEKREGKTQMWMGCGVNDVEAGKKRKQNFGDTGSPKDGDPLHHKHLFGGRRPMIDKTKIGRMKNWDGHGGTLTETNFGIYGKSLQRRNPAGGVSKK